MLKSFLSGGKKKAVGVSTIDDAQQQNVERIRRRRNSLGNVFGGTSSTAPTTAAKQLLGT